MKVGNLGRATLTMLTLTGCVSMAPLSSAFVAPRALRMSDEVVARDEARFDSLMMSAKGDARRQAYVSLAREAYERNDDGALTTLLLAASSNTSPMPRTRAPQLWAVVDVARRSGDAQQGVIDLEMALVRAEHPLLGAPTCAAWEAKAGVIASALRPAASPPQVVAVAPPALPRTPVPGAVPAAVTPPVAITAAPVLRGIPSMVHFGLNLHNLSPASQRVLNVLVDSLRRFPEVRIVLEGHTDPRASVAYNNALSRRRSTSVMTYLLAKGIAASRVEIVARGKSQLASEQMDVVSLATNRRVQLRYYLPDGREVVATQLLDDLQLETRRRR
jgi:outer membrane protein OmpA-like peptidoglycan-associated protein